MVVRVGLNAEDQMRPVNDTLLDEMTSKLVKEFQPEQVILLGSHAWGTPEKSSDVDLMVIVDESDLSDYERAVLALGCLSDVDVPKDVIVKKRAEFDFFRNVRASLEHKIAHRGKVLYERDSGKAESALSRLTR
jgi:predicted nucleotidyltransferase